MPGNDPGAKITNFYINMKTWSKFRDVSITAILDKAGISKNYYSQMKSEKRSPTLLYAIKIAEAMNISLDALLLPPEKFHRRLYF